MEGLELAVVLEALGGAAEEPGTRVAVRQRSVQARIDLEELRLSTPEED
jgi:hypothetical protein